MGTPQADLNITWPCAGGRCRKVWSVLLFDVAGHGRFYLGCYPPSAAWPLRGAPVRWSLPSHAAKVSGRRHLGLTARSCADVGHMVFSIVIGVFCSSRFLLIKRFHPELRNVDVATEIRPLGFIAVTIRPFLLLLGMFRRFRVSDCDSGAGFSIPIRNRLGDRRESAFAVPSASNLIEIAAITPPVGLNLYAVLAAFRR